MLAIGRKEAVLEKDQSLLAEDRMREDGGGTSPFSVLALWGLIWTQQNKVGSVVCWSCQEEKGDQEAKGQLSGDQRVSLSGPLFSAYDILAKPVARLKGWSVCRFVLLSEKPSSQHTLATGEPVLGPHFAVPRFSESDAGSPGEADLWGSWEVRAGPLHHELLNRSNENFCPHSFSAFTQHLLKLPQPPKVPQDFAQCSWGGWREKLQKHRVVLYI